MSKLIFLFLAPLLFASSVNTEVKWNENQLLTWSDFSGKIDSSSEYDAWTWSGFNYSYTWDVADGGPIVECEAYAFFDPSQSWVKKNKQSEELLRHEQVHFNISELHARYFKEKVDVYQFTMEVETEMEVIYNTTFEDLLAMQIQYDEETDHCKKKEEQVRWINFVNDELKRLVEYK